jgi:hypothetical protein
MVHMPFNNKLGFGHEANYELSKDDINWQRRRYKAFPAYGDSKMYLTMFTKAFNFWNYQRATDGPQDPAAKDSGLAQKKLVKCVSLHPGVINTGIFSSFGSNLVPFWSWIHWLITPILWIVTRNETDGAQTILYTGLIPFDKLQQGEYYDDCGVGNCSKHINDEGCKDLWDRTVNIVGGRVGKLNFDCF